MRPPRQTVGVGTFCDYCRLSSTAQGAKIIALVSRNTLKFMPTFGITLFQHFGVISKVESLFGVQSPWVGLFFWMSGVMWRQRVLLARSLGILSDWFEELVPLWRHGPSKTGVGAGLLILGSLISGKHRPSASTRKEVSKHTSLELNTPQVQVLTTMDLRHCRNS
jgi:hypothetical protein